MKWTPIEDFDKNNWHKFLFWIDRCEIGEFSERWDEFTDHNGLGIEPTHFMPLPEGPK